MKVIITPKWIPVTERLPDALEDVLVYRPTRCYNGEFVKKNYSLEYHTGDQFVFDKVFGPATHWMPLPGAPKE